MKGPNKGGLIKVGALWTWERVRDGHIIDVQHAHNTVPTEGLNHILNTVFHAGSAIDPWYICLWTGDITPVATDTYAVPRYTEFQSYSEANRVEFVESAASGGICSNASNRAIFTTTSEDTIYGSSLVGGGTDADTKADTAGGGVLVSSVRMGTPTTYHVGDVIRITVEITLVSA
jgi:hypothetical protein